MRKVLPWTWNGFPTPRKWPPKSLYLNRRQWVGNARGRRGWHGACNR
jgi:hypothetical protein